MDLYTFRYMRHNIDPRQHGVWNTSGKAVCTGQNSGCGCNPTTALCGDALPCDENGCNGAVPPEGGDPKCRDRSEGCVCELKNTPTITVPTDLANTFLWILWNFEVNIDGYTISWAFFGMPKDTSLDPCNQDGLLFTTDLAVADWPDAYPDGTFSLTVIAGRNCRYMGTKNGLGTLTCFDSILGDVAARCGFQDQTQEFPCQTTIISSAVSYQVAGVCVRDS
jgi:hypothetical protein